MKDILQAIIDGKQLEAAGGVTIDHKTALNYLSRGLTVTIQPDTVQTSERTANAFVNRNCTKTGW